MIKFGTLKLDPTALGSQGNAILGIRDSGKTYTATVLAERLFDAGVPFVAFDPIGVWRFLRVPGNGRGYPVVVAGGQEGDLPLTVTGAPEIVRAAMANGVSLVIDLFDINLSKADWKRIVTACVRVLLHENQQHGLRHVFIEEAAEFAPQRIGPDQGAVYAEIEKLARMGGNARLGYTLINQRAEEVNKAVLELCDNLFLHRQKGRNSLTALSKWLDIGNVAEHKEIIASLPTLPTGECWAWMQGSETPARIRVPAKASFHPDRRVMRGGDKEVTKKAVDVGSFVETMRGTLKTIEQDARTLEELKAENAKLRREATIANKRAEQAGVPEKEVQARIAAAVAEVRKLVPAAGNNSGNKSSEGLRRALLKVGEVSAKALADWSLDGIPTGSQAGDSRGLVRAGHTRPVSARPAAAVASAAGNAGGDITAPQQKILDVLAQLEAYGIQQADKAMVAAHAGVSPTSGGYFNNLGRLRSGSLIDYPSPGKVALTLLGRARATPPKEAPTLLDLHESWLRILPAPQRAILFALIEEYPSAIAKDDLADRVGVSRTSGGYFNNLGRLRTLGAIEYPARGQVIAAEILFPKVRT